MNVEEVHEVALHCDMWVLIAFETSIRIFEEAPMCQCACWVVWSGNSRFKISSQITSSITGKIVGSSIPSIAHGVVNTSLWVSVGECARFYVFNDAENFIVYSVNSILFRHSLNPVHHGVKITGY